MTEGVWDRVKDKREGGSDQRIANTDIWKGRARKTRTHSGRGREETGRIRQPDKQQIAGC